MKSGLLTLALCALVALVAACGGDVVPFDTIASAAVKTEEAGSARVALQGSITLEHDHAKRVSLKGDAVVDWRTNSTRLRVSYSFRDDVQWVLEKELGGKPTAELIMDGHDGLVMYMTFSFIEDQLPPGKRWLKVDLEEAGKARGVDIGPLMETSQSDPARMLQYLKATGDLEKIGTDLVRRELTTHYTATVDAHKVADEAPADERKAMEASIRLTGIDTYPMDVWIGEDGLLRKIQLTLEYKQPDTGWVQMAISEELHDFGAQVDIEPPPADRVLDVTELAAGHPLRHRSS